MANYTPGEAIMFCAIFVCLFALALLALARPLRMLCKCGISAVLGAFCSFWAKALARRWVSMPQRLRFPHFWAARVAGMFC